MSSAVFSTSAAQGRPFVFDSENGAEVCPQPSGNELFGEPRPPQRVVSPESFKDARLASITPASRLTVHPAPEMVSSGISAIDQLTGGSASRLPDGNLRSRLFRPQHLDVIRAGCCHPARRILRGGGCQRRSRSAVCCRNWA